MNYDPENPFADLDEGLFDLSEPTEQEGTEFMGQTHSKATIARYESPCPAKCSKGTFISWSGRAIGQCFKCKGKGFILTKTNPATLKAQKEKREAKKKAADIKASIEAKQFLEENTTMADWLTNGKSDFAKSLLTQLVTKGALSEKQIAAIDASIEREAGWAIEREAKNKAALKDANPALLSIIKHFKAAKESGLKKPRLRLESLTLSMAPDTGVNAGCIYAKSSDDEYLGKILPTGLFRASYYCSEIFKEYINSLDDNVFAQAVIYGQETGRCSCCGRELTDPNSIAAGIGPICAENWAF